MSEIGEYEITIFREHKEQMYYIDSNCHRKLTASFPEAILWLVFLAQWVNKNWEGFNEKNPCSSYTDATVREIKRKRRQYVQTMFQIGSQDTYTVCE